MMMKNFLGPELERPDNETVYFEQALSLGQSYMESGLWSAAIPFLTTAHETAVSLLATQQHDPIDAMYDYCTASVLLMLAYRKLALITEAFEIYVKAIETVEALNISRNELKDECIENINFQFPDAQPSTGKPSERIMAH